MAKVNVGINRMIVTAPGLYIKPEQIAIPVTEKEIYAKLRKEAEEAKKGGKEWKQPSDAELDKMIAEAVPVTVSKMRKGLGIETIRLPGYSESNATFVADAVYDFIKGAAGNPETLKKLMGEPVKVLYFGTESNPDRSRPELEVSLMLAFSKLLDEDEGKYRPIVEMLRSARVVPVTYACVGGVLSVYEAASDVRHAVENGKHESAIVITADTAYYSPKTAPGAEATQGAAATLMWITKDPKFVVVGDKVGMYHLTVSDFTKFVLETPVVHGKFSEIVYVYTVARALENLEAEMKSEAGRGRSRLGEFDFLVSHVPFPKQAIYLTSFLFVHELRNFNPALLRDIEGREGIGREPIEKEKFRHLTDLIESKFRSFNQDGGEAKEENAIIKHIEDDKEIKEYWEWLKKVRDVPEFEAFLKKLGIREALKIPSDVGNSYSGSALVSLASLAQNTRLDHIAGRWGILAGYGSGAQAMAFPVTLVASQQTINDVLTVSLSNENRYALNAKQYKDLHFTLISGDSARLTSGEDLVEKDRKMLELKVLSRGFHVVRRNPDGTGEYAYSDGRSVSRVKIRH